MKVVSVGAGNLATCLMRAMKKAGMEVVQVYSRTVRNAQRLGEELDCGWTTCPEEVRTDAGLYVFSLKDKALPDVIARVRPNEGLWVHTAGSMPITVFEGYASRCGVMYPLQTFSKERQPDFNRIPFFLEAVSEKDAAVLATVARSLSGQVAFLPSEKRKCLHLAAVFACNFTNHMYVQAARLLEEAGISFEVLLPLIDETAAKVHEMAPAAAQTGPAVRYDEPVIAKHLELLADPDRKELYRLISRSIHKEAEK